MFDVDEFFEFFVIDFKVSIEVNVFFLVDVFKKIVFVIE